MIIMIWSYIYIIFKSSTTNSCCNGLKIIGSFYYYYLYTFKWKEKIIVT